MAGGHIFGRGTTNSVSAKGILPFFVDFQIFFKIESTLVTSFAVLLFVGLKSLEVDWPKENRQIFYNLDPSESISFRNLGKDTTESTTKFVSSF